jgi:TRAP-type mannitol/chloroaromatic compound transport system permease small subunit
MLKKILKTIDSISEISGKTFSYLILPVVILEAVEVVRRYVFDSPTDWSWELAALTAGAMFVMGAGWALRDDKHVRTDLIYGKLPRKWQAIFDLFFFTFIFFSFTSVLIVKSTQQAIYSVGIQERTFSMWAPPLYPLKIVIALSFIVLGLQGLAKWIRDLYFLVKGREI